MVYRIILKDGELTGKYSDKKSPGLVARAIMKVIFQKTGATSKEIKFKNDRNGKLYTYRAKIIKLERPRTVVIKGKKFLQKYDIFAERI